MPSFIKIGSGVLAPWGVGTCNFSMLSLKYVFFCFILHSCCIIVSKVGCSWWDWILIFGPIFLQCFDTVGWFIRPVKPVPDMTYNVFGGTLSHIWDVDPTRPILKISWPHPTHVQLCMTYSVWWDVKPCSLYIYTAAQRVIVVVVFACSATRFLFKLMINNSNLYQSTRRALTFAKTDWDDFQNFIGTSLQGCGLDLDVSVSRRINVSSREKLSTSRSREADVSVSANYVSCPRPIFGQIVQATLTKRTQSQRAL